MTKIMKTAQLLLVASGIAFTGTLPVVPAQAAANLQCNAPFNKKVLSNTTVRCQKKSSSFSSKRSARTAANSWMSSAGCNSHQSPPVKKVWKKANGKWAARVKFICALIT